MYGDADQLQRRCTAWTEAWIKQFGADEALLVIAAIEDFGRFLDLSLVHEVRSSQTPRSLSEAMAWLATTPDPLFGQLVVVYLESLFVDPDWSVERIGTQMGAMGRARTAAFNGLGPLLDA